jgi:hydrogenase expression/formation protein HypC
MGGPAVCLGEIGRVVSVWEEGGRPVAVVRTADAELRASLLYLPEAQEGAYVLMHLGFAVELLDARDAAAALALRRGEEGERSA